MQITIITLFPEMFQALNYGIIGRAQQQSLLKINLLNLRDFSQNKHQRVDDKPYGGGPGMVLQAQPLQAAIEKALMNTPADTPVSYTSPQGEDFNQNAAQALSKRSHLILIAGRYEGIDERICQTHIQEMWSIGDFVLTGGELPVMCMIDAVTRLLPGVLGNPQSALDDSFTVHQGLLDFPHYTRPQTIAGVSVPSVLVSGHHQAIQTWRLQQALGNTWRKRPDLLEKRGLNAKEKQLLVAFIANDTKENPPQ